MSDSHRRDADPRAGALPGDPTPSGDRSGRGTAILPIAAEQAWELVTDVRNHARWIPFTRIEATHPLRVGDTFTAITGPSARFGGLLGARRTHSRRDAHSRRAWGLVDRMVVTESTPPATAPPRTGRATYRKLGPVLLGDAEVLVEPLGPGRCRVMWLERIHLRGLPARLVAPAARPLASAMVRSALRKVRAEVVRGAVGR